MKRPLRNPGLAPLGLGLLLLSPWFQGCTQKNAMGRRVVTLMPDSMLQQQAATAFADQRTENKVSTNSAQKELVQRVADRLIAQAKVSYREHVKDFQWEVELFESDQVNAYCMPGGKIGFYTGILPICANEAGIAAVMGHEIGHAILRHGNARVTQAMALEAVQAVASEVMGESAKKTALLTAVGLGGQYGVILPNSRVDENEADHLGIRLMAQAGYDPSEAPRLWERMKAAGGQSPPEFMSTHPSEDRRIRRLGEFQAEVAPLYAAAQPQYGLGQAIP